MPIAGHATTEGTIRYATKHSEAVEGHFRRAGELTLSSIGIGTYLGEADEPTDRAYAETVAAAVRGGLNVIDTAVNYRFQRSERSVGGALAALGEEEVGRDEIVLCTKGGYVPFDGAPPASREDLVRYIQETFVVPGIASLDDFVQLSHCLAPPYLMNQLETSLRNLGVECVDVYYLHNPETQRPVVGPDAFLERIRDAFAFLELAVGAGRIRAYGLATWNGFRRPPEAPDHLDLPALAGVAEAVGGPGHHFRWVQLPVNLALTEAHLARNQGDGATLLETARALGINVAASASLLQARLAHDLPQPVSDVFPDLSTDALRSLQFARSVPGVTTALVGMSDPDHLRENLELIRVPPAGPEAIDRLFEGT
jgi:aryl-alcohol dehydrogenase-like predicted oxidoreductase